MKRYLCPKVVSAFATVAEQTAWKLGFLVPALKTVLGKRLGSR